MVEWSTRSSLRLVAGMVALFISQIRRKSSCFRASAVIRYKSQAEV